MANVIFYHTGSEDTTFTASGGGDTINLQDRNPNHTWTSASLSSGQSLIIDLNSAKAVDSCVVDGANFLTNGATTITLQSSALGVTYISVTTFSLSNSVQVITFPSETKQYWKILFTKTSGSLSTYPIIGNIFLGTKIEMTIPYDSGYKTSRAFQTNKNRAIDGTYYSSQIYSGIDNYNFKFSNITNTLSDLLETLFNSVKGGLYPFYYSDTDSALLLVILDSDENDLTKDGYNVNNVALQFKTYLVQ